MVRLPAPAFPPLFQDPENATGPLDSCTVAGPTSLPWKMTVWSPAEKLKKPLAEKVIVSFGLASSMIMLATGAALGAQISAESPRGRSNKWIAFILALVA